MSIKHATYLLELTGADDCREREVIQSLWSGYGQIVRVELTGAPVETVVVKHIQLRTAEAHPRGWNTDHSHQRKIQSYEVENHWYQQWSKHCNDECKVPNFYGALEEGGERIIVMEDLATDFPVVEDSISYAQVEICLVWLAHFHATFLDISPDGLWPVGTYWHLDTRPDEWSKLEHAELKAKARAIDATLSNCRFKTFVHGDAKLANFCFSSDRKRVAAVDFQYVGGGCGIKDVVYFLGSCLNAEENELYETELLNYYFSELKKAVSKRMIHIDFSELEKEWRGLYAYASADFLRFLLGWMPSHHKINDYSLRLLDQVLNDA